MTMTEETSHGRDIHCKRSRWRARSTAPSPTRWRPTTACSSSARMSARSAACSAITDGLTARFGEHRCFDTPLAEAGIVGTAVGMAMNGMLPVVEMQFDAFAYPAFEQVVSHVAKMGNRTRGAVRLPDGDPHSLRRRHRRRRAPLRLVRGVLRAHTRPDRARAGDPAGRLLDAARGDPSIPTRSSSSSRRSSTGRRARSTPSAADDRPRRRRAPRHRCDAARLRNLGLRSRSRPRRPRKRRVAAFRSSTSARSTPFDDETVMAAVRSTGRAVVIAEAPGFASVAVRDRGPCQRALLRLPRGAGAPRHRIRCAVRAAQARALLPARRRPHPRRRRLALPAGTTDDARRSSACPTWVRDSPRRRSCAGSSPSATPSRRPADRRGRDGEEHRRGAVALRRNGRRAARRRGRDSRRRRAAASRWMTRSRHCRARPRLRGCRAARRTARRSAPARATCSSATARGRHAAAGRRRRPVQGIGLVIALSHPSRAHRGRSRCALPDRAPARARGRGVDLHAITADRAATASITRPTCCGAVSERGDAPATGDTTAGLGHRPRAEPLEHAAQGRRREDVRAAAPRSPRRPSGSMSTPPSCGSCAGRWPVDAHAARPLTAIIAKFVLLALAEYPRAGRPAERRRH